MSVIQIDIKHIGQMILIVFAFIGLLGLIACGLWVVMIPHTETLPTTPNTYQQTLPTITINPTPYPSVITFTVLSTTTSNGHYSIYTTTGQTLYCANYNEWDYLYPQGIYVADVTGIDGTAYTVKNVVLISRQNAPERYQYGYNHPVYYSWDDRYYRYDGRIVEEVPYKQVNTNRPIYSQPPIGYRNGDYRRTW